MGFEEMDAVAEHLDVIKDGQPMQRAGRSGSAVAAVAAAGAAASVVPAIDASGICFDGVGEAVADVAFHVAVGILGAVVETAIESLFDAC